LTILALNFAAHDAAFDPIRALDPDIEVVHAEYRTPWEEVSARRTGAALAVPEMISDELRTALARADVIFAFMVPRSVRALAPHLHWVETPATGIDHMRGTGVLEAEVIVTTIGGHFAPVIAEHVFAGMLHFAKRLALFEQQRRDRTWQMERVRMLTGCTLGLVGIGSIGAAVAALGKAFGMRTVGLGRGAAPSRQVAHIDRVMPRSALRELLSVADYAVIAVADTPETQRMIGTAELAAMKPDAVLVNVARGTVIDEPALIAALRDQRIAGAALDVFAKEPLPQDSPLWALPNVLITPHIAASIVEYLPQAITLFTDNVRRFIDGTPLERQFDRGRGY